MERVNPKENRYFNYKEYLVLCSKIGHAVKENLPDADFDADTMKRTMHTFHKYVDTVDYVAVNEELAKSRLETGSYELHEELERFEMVKNAHKEIVKTNVLLINRLAQAYSCDPIFTGSKDSGDSEAFMSQVSDFCLEVTTKLFMQSMAAA